MWFIVSGCAWLDRSPPVITVEGPTGVVREAELVIRVHDDEPGVKSVAIAIDGTDPIPLELPPDRVIRWTLPELPDMEHELVVTAVDASLLANVGTHVHRVTTDRSPPPLELAPASAGQGRTLAIWVRSPEPLIDPVVKLSVMGKEPEDPPVEEVLELLPVDGAWRALRGVEIKEPPGPHALVVEASDPLGNHARLEATYEVVETRFEKGGYIRLSKKQKEARKDTDAIAKMREERNAAYAFVQPQQRWKGPFVKPVPSADLTSPFGKYRSYSDGRKSYHTGLDLSEEPGTPVLAAGGGQVMVAHEQAIFGNVVIVHHGHGVATSYNHLERIDVKEGDQVEAGQQVGLLGSTGQSTGPHLHWGLEVNVVAVDPHEWMLNGFDRSPWSAGEAPVAQAPPPAAADPTASPEEQEGPAEPQ